MKPTLVLSGAKAGCIPHIITVSLWQNSDRGRVLCCPVVDNAAAVGDTGSLPAFPELGILAPMLKKDVADAWRVTREGVGELLPCGITPL